MLRICLLVPAVGIPCTVFSSLELTAQIRVCDRVPVLSESAVVSVLTVLPGDRMYSLFGHTIIRVRDPETGLDCGFNYGTFDFPQTLLGGAGFIAKFAYGELDYELGVSESPLVASDWYWRQERRPTIEQTLALTPDQVRSISAMLWENARPENRVYRYDFFFDNCSTRPRDLFEAVLGPGLEAGLEDPKLSFRQLLDPYLVGHPGVDLSMDIGLGLPA
ncbi:MAG: lipoprotein N-acyltransferase Lnb domain-containing protein, partial [Gemmatimonadota bacterium]